MENYEKVMIWAIGPGWKSINPKNCDIFFASEHPEYEPLKKDESLSPTQMACYYTYQMFLAYHKINRRKNLSFRTFFTSNFHKFRNFLVKIYHG